MLLKNLTIYCFFKFYFNFFLLNRDTTESIKRELAEQEASWKAKVATLERRSHEQWLARRAAERLAEASSKEAQTLRQRLAAPSPDKSIFSIFLRSFYKSFK